MRDDRLICAGMYAVLRHRQNRGRVVDVAPRAAVGPEVACYWLRKVDEASWAGQADQSWKEWSAGIMRRQTVDQRTYRWYVVTTGVDDEVGLICHRFQEWMRRVSVDDWCDIAVSRCEFCYCLLSANKTCDVHTWVSGCELRQNSAANKTTRTDEYHVCLSRHDVDYS